MVWRSGEGWENDLEARPAVTIIKAVVIAVLAVLAVVALVWGLITGFSYWWGQGNATRDKNSATNFEQAQATFHRDYNQVITDRVKIQAARADLATWQQEHPNYQGNGTPYDPLIDEENQKEQALAGIQAECLAEVTGYDDASQAYLSADWRDAGLPAHLDPAMACDPAKPAP